MREERAESTFLIFVDFSWLFRERLTLAARKHHTEPGGTIIGSTRTAGPDNSGFPIGLVLIDFTGRFSTFGDVNPWGIKSRKIGDLAP